MENLHKTNLYPTMRAIIQELTIQNVAVFNNLRLNVSLLSEE